MSLFCNLAQPTSFYDNHEYFFLGGGGYINERIPFIILGTIIKLENGFSLFFLTYLLKLLFHYFDLAFWFLDIRSIN